MGTVVVVPKKKSLSFFCGTCIVLIAPTIWNQNAQNIAQTLRNLLQVARRQATPLVDQCSSAQGSSGWRGKLDFRLTTEGPDCLQFPPSSPLVVVQLVGSRLLGAVAEICSREQLPNVVAEAFWLRGIEIVELRRRRAAASMYPR